MSKKISKEEAKSKDVMTQELQKGFTWSVQHYKLVLGFLGAFILAGSVYSGINFLNNKKEAKVQESFYQIEKDYLAKKEKFEAAAKPEPTKNEKANGQAKAPPPTKPEDKATGDLDKDYGGTVKGFHSVIDESPGSRAARMSALMLTEVYLQYGQKDKGLETLKKVGLENDLLSVLIEDRKAGLLAEQGDCKSAISTWDRLLANKETSFMAAEIKLKKGLCFESLKDYNQAGAMYNQAKELDSNSPVAKRAEKYLRLLPTLASTPSSTSKN